MGKDDALEALKAAADASGLIEPGSDGIVMVSGGADSACTLAALGGLVGPAGLHALHVNYGLRDAATADEQVVRRLCAMLRIDLHVERVERGQLGPGNLQAAARAARYMAADALRARFGASWIATGHTRSDVAETVVYRLASSPGARALLGLPSQSGRVIRPLIALSAEQTRDYATAAGLPFTVDASNSDTRFARNRIRADVLPALAALSPQAERNIAETRAELSEDARLLERVALQALEDAGTAAADTNLDAQALLGWEPALRRLALRALAERASGKQVALGRSRAAEIARLAADPEGGEVQLGGGVSAICESGTVSFAVSSALDAAPAPRAVALSLPGSCRLGEWELRAELHPAPVQPAGPALATLDAAVLEGPLEVRHWRRGDRITPLGMGGSKTLGDLFADHGVPRSQRGRLPVVLAGGRVAWVAGVAVSDEFRLGTETTAAAVITARPV
ncbi:MAG: tRNA lysidine(34) synthetase TilS [Actinomycetota bacterium]|nr:tRNA lysidine(34) synthetase TilS [Actinomycetota bacterium]